MSVLAQGDTSVETPATQTSLVDLLDRLLGVGVVISGDVMISLAGVDLVTVKLLALLSSVGTVEQRPR